MNEVRKGPTGRDISLDTLTHLLQREGRKGKPGVRIHIFFTSHDSAKGLTGFKEALSTADIFIPEAPGAWGHDDIFYNGISRGTISPQEALVHSQNRSFDRVLFNSIYNSQKPITLADIPKSHPLVNEYERVDMATNRVNFKGNFQHAIVRTRHLLTEEARIFEERDDYILTQLAPKIERVMKENPQLKTKKEVSVLMFLGAYHTNVFYELRKISDKTTRSFGYYPIIYSLRDEAGKRLSFGKEVDDTFIARVLLEILIYTKLLPMLQVENNEEQNDKLCRQIALSYSIDEIARLFDDGNRGKDVIKSLVLSIIKKGIPIPHFKLGRRGGRRFSLHELG